MDPFGAELAAEGARARLPSVLSGMCGRLCPGYRVPVILGHRLRRTQIVAERPAEASAARVRTDPGLAVAAAVRWSLGHTTALLWGIAAVGALLRVARYLDNRSLWLDEAFLAINLTDKSFSDLFGRLEFLQSAPAGFLAAEKAAVTVLGDSEYALRLVPLLASIAALALFVHVAGRLLPPLAAVLAVALFATNPELLYYSSEVKPYSSDVAVGLLLLALGLHAAEAGERPLRRLAPLAVAAPIAVWFSFPSVFVLGAVAVPLLLRAVREGDRRQLAAVTAVFGAAAVSFAAVYAVASTNVSRTADALFPSATPHGLGRLSELAHDSWSLIVNPGGFDDGTNALAALLLVIGVLALRRRLPWLALLGLPLVLAAAADLLGRYPLGSRFSLFLVPSLLLLVAAGVAAAVGSSRRPFVAAGVLAFFVAAPLLGRAAADVVSPPRSEDVRPLLAHLARNWEPGDALYVYRNSQYALRYYGACEDCDPPGSSYPWPVRPAPQSASGEQFAPALQPAPPELYVGAQRRDRGETILAEADELPAGRVWLLFSHVSAARELDEEALLRLALDERGTALDSIVEPGAALYLYELDRS